MKSVKTASHILPFAFSNKQPSARFRQFANYLASGQSSAKLFSIGGAISSVAKSNLDEKSAQSLNLLGITERALLNLQSIDDENVLLILAKIISCNEKLATLISMLILEKQGRYAISIEEWKEYTAK
jgi:hypothetical protein